MWSCSLAKTQICTNQLQVGSLTNIQHTGYLYFYLKNTFSETIQTTSRVVDDIGSFTTIEINFYE